MPIRPPTPTYSCHACNWSKTIVPRSDALMPGEISSTPARHVAMHRWR